MESNSLELVDLVIGREGIPLCSPMNLRAGAGDIVAIRGQNGSGKSTLLKTLVGLLPPISGEVRITPSAEPMGYIGHRSGMLTEMSVEANVRFWANASGCPELAIAAFYYFGLSDILDVTLHTLSAGWQQRVSLTRLITIPSKIWILDEPASNLDEEGAGLLHGLIETRYQQGGIVVLATHGTVQAKNIKIIEIK